MGRDRARRSTGPVAAAATARQALGARARGSVVRASGGGQLPADEDPAFAGEPHAFGVPLSIVAAVLACACMLVGWCWDISWHRCIGRDTVWTPAHVAIYIALALAFAYNATLVLSCTWGARRGVPCLAVLGFRGPAGAFVTLFGVLLQFTAVLFDNWWHAVYGLDSAVFSPPHALIAWGINIFYFGQILLAVRWRNRFSQPPARAHWILQAMFALLIGHWALAVDPSYGPEAVRTRLFVATSPFAFATVLVLIHSYLGTRWASTISAALYMGLLVLLMQLFQLFPAAPRFGPVFHRVDHFYPPLFPLLLVVPAFVVDLVVGRNAGGAPWRASLAVAPAFVAAFTAANWALSGLLVSPWSHNRLLAGGYPGAAFELHDRVSPQVGANLVGVACLAVALIVSVGMARVAMGAGTWLRAAVR